MSAEGALDTGAQCNLIQVGILSPGMFQDASNPLRLVTATGAPLPGGFQEVVTCLLFCAQGYGEVRYNWRRRTVLLEAQIHADMILGYPWMQSKGYI